MLNYIIVFVLFLFAAHKSIPFQTLEASRNKQSTLSDTISDKNSQQESSRDSDTIGDKNSPQESSRRDSDTIRDRATKHPSNHVTVSGKFPFQPNAARIVHQQLKTKKLYFQQSWFEKYPWLHYDPTLKAVLCFYCSNAYAADVLGSAKCTEPTFTSSGFSNWKKLRAVVDALNFIRALIVIL